MPVPLDDFKPVAWLSRDGLWWKEPAIGPHGLDQRYVRGDRVDRIVEALKAATAALAAADQHIDDEQHHETHNAWCAAQSALAEYEGCKHG